MSNILVTGGGRGIGLELARQLVELPKSSVSKVFVTTRGTISSALQTLIEESAGRVINISCEITDTSSVKAAAAELDTKLAGEGLDILINNAGVGLPVYETEL